MLILDGEPFTSGRSRFFDQHPRFAEPTAKVFVQVEIPGYDGPLLAQVDTGAAYSILETAVAEATGLLGRDGSSTRISTRLGTILGKLIRHRLTLIADAGESLELDMTLFVSEGWTGPTVLGYSGCLDHLRVGLDALPNMFYFGEHR
jgi:hypothetical protein